MDRIEPKEKVEPVMALSLLARFRSKEDLWKYLSQHGKRLRLLDPLAIVGVFLPSIHGTTLAFMRDILKNEKRALRTNEVVHLEIPLYPEISVKNLYDDAMADAEVARYLPSQDQMGGRLPERNFFFGVLGTLKRHYLTEIIKDAHNKRFKVPEDNANKDAILIADAWMEELTKHPYYSSKVLASNQL
jgi:hypothetical protein